MQTLKMDFQSQSTPPVVPVMQSDAQSRFIGITLYDGGVPYSAPSGAQYTVQYRGPGANNMGWYDTIQLSSGTRKAVVVSSSSPNVVTLELAEQALRVNGKVEVSLCVVNNTGYKLNTFPIICRVTGAPYVDPVSVRSYFYVTGLTSEQWLAYVTACQDAQKRAEDAAAKLVIDSTLTQKGQAADAKATGEAVGELGLKKNVKTSLKSDYLENAPTMNINPDFVYTLGDKARIFRNVKKLKLSILSNGGTGTIFLYRPDSVYSQILVYKKSYALIAGKNEIDIDISEKLFDVSPTEGHDYISIAIYSNDSGTFTSQNGQLYLYSNGDPLAWYGSYSDFNVSVNNFIPPQNYWSGNLETNKTYPCIDVYMEEEIPKCRSGIIRVAKDGTGDYSTIMDAVRNAGDIESPATIVLQEGVYDEIVYLGNKHKISIIGVNRDQCIVKNTSGIYANTPIMVAGDFELRNLTIRMEVQDFYPEYTDNVWATYPGYALHIDGNSKNVDEKTTGRVVNCTLYSEAFPAVGMGVNQNQNVIFENCEMIRNCTKDIFKQDNWKGAFLCHSSNYSSAPNQRLSLRNCIMRSNYGYSGNIRGNLGDSSNFHVEAIDNTCYSEEMGIDSFEYISGDSILAPISHGNTASVLNAPKS